MDKREDVKLSATEKTMLVLEAAIVDGHLSQIAQSTGLSVATVHRILADMVRAGWLFQAHDKVYRPGRRSYAFASHLTDESQLEAIVSPFLAELTDKTGLTSHLGVIRDDSIVYVAKVDAEKPYRMNSRVGGVVPLHSTAIGKAVLAQMPQEQAVELIDRTGMDPITPHTLTSPEQLQIEFEAVRNQGWAQDDEENEEGLRCVGAHIRGLNGGVSVSGLKYEVDEATRDELAKAVLETAQQISVALGE